MILWKVTSSLENHHEYYTGQETLTYTYLSIVASVVA